MTATHELIRIEDGEEELVAWGSKTKMAKLQIEMSEEVAYAAPDETAEYRVITAKYPEHHHH